MKLLMTTAIIAMTAFGANAATLEEFCASTQETTEMLVKYSSTVSQEGELSIIHTDDFKIRNYWAGVINDIYTFNMTKEQAVKAAYDRCIEQFGG